MNWLPFIAFWVGVAFGWIAFWARVRIAVRRIERAFDRASKAEAAASAARKRAAAEMLENIAEIRRIIDQKELN